MNTQNTMGPKRVLVISKNTITAMKIAKLTMVLVVAVVLVAFVVPWTPSIAATGSVIALDPSNRTLTIEATIAGQIDGWKVQEGQYVEKGQVLAEIRQNDPNYRSRAQGIARQASNAVGNVESTIVQLDAKVDALESEKVAAVEKAKLGVAVARQELIDAQQAIATAEASLLSARQDIKRLTGLSADGLVSTRNIEVAQAAETSANAKLLAEKAKAAAARTKVRVAKANVKAVRAEKTSKIVNAKASLEKSKADKAKAVQDFAKATTTAVEQDAMLVRAPTTGYVLETIAGQGLELVKQGDVIATIVPISEDRAVELWVDGNDVPWVEEGRDVRIQFEGWPAVQFTGWPSVAAGTFAGTVKIIAPAATKNGKTRVVIVKSPGYDWPNAEQLRQGTNAIAWVLLEESTVAYEVWRRINGFPPQISENRKAKKKK